MCTLPFCQFKTLLVIYLYIDVYPVIEINVPIQYLQIKSHHIKYQNHSNVNAEEFMGKTKAEQYFYSYCFEWLLFVLYSANK